MTVTSMVPSDTPYLPPKVAEVSKEVLRSFPHSKKVGNYLLGTTLGEGSFAKVKEALHIPTGERVAVKIIDKQKSREDSYVRKNLRREGKILQMVRHSNVIQLLEIMETQNSYYLVTDLCRGGDLMDHISQRRKLPELEVKKFIRQIVSAVDYLHRLGILHRDVKIENLLLDEYQNMQIIDFGLSNCIKVVHTKDGTKAQEFCVTQCGSPAYAAPELLGRRKYGPQVDVWSIGINMYAMLTGNLPFTIEPFNIKALHNKMVSGQMNPIPEGISRDCRDLIKKFLNPDPDRRIRLEDVMKHPWICEGVGSPLTRAPCPNKMKSESLDNSIIKHMSDHLGFRVGEVIRFVTGNIPSSATAMYHLFHRKLAKHYGNLRVMGKIPADHRLLGRSQQYHGPKINSQKCNTCRPSQQRAPRTINTTNLVRNSLPAHKVKAATDTMSTKDSTSDKDDGEENNEDNQETFIDLTETTDSPSGTTAGPPSRPASIARVLTSRETPSSPLPTVLPNVANKYVVGNLHRKLESCNVGKTEDQNAKPSDDSTPEAELLSDVLNSEEEPYRKRASTFPGKIARPTITVNRKLFAHVQKGQSESNHKQNGDLTTQQYHINTSVSKNRKPGGRPATGEPNNNSKHGYNQHMYALLRNQTHSRAETSRRPSVKNNVTNYVAREEANRRLTPDSEKSIPQRQPFLLRQNVNFNKIYRVKADVSDEVADEHISLITNNSSRPSTPGNTTSSRLSLSNTVSPGGLPCLSPTHTVTSSRRS